MIGGKQAFDALAKDKSLTLDVSQMNINVQLFKQFEELLKEKGVENEF